MQLGDRKSAILLVLGSAVLWGFYWMPIYRLESRGFEGAWAGLSINAATLASVAFAGLVGLAFARRRPSARPMSRGAIAGALFCGAGISLYASAISFTEVIRAVLFFYLSPVWSTAIECLFMGRRWSWRNALAIAVTGLGLVVVCRGEIPLEGLGAAGDWMAVAAGLAWSVGTSMIFSRSESDPVPLTLLSIAGALAVSGVTIWVGGATMGAPPSLEAVAGAGWELAGFGLLYLAPIVFLTMWGAQKLNPAAMGFLLTAEILSGIASSAMFLDQPFGVMEIAGAVLIVAGATVEVTTPVAAERRAVPASREL